MFDREDLQLAGKDFANLDGGELSDDVLLELAVGLEELSSCVDLARAHLAAELDVRDLCFARDGLKTATWLAREANTSPASTGSVLKVGRALRNGLTVVDDAVVAGEVSFEHAKTIVGVCNPRNRHRVAAAQAELIGNADGNLFDRWREETKRFADLVDDDGPFDPNAELARNRARFVRRGDGTGELHCELDPERFLGLSQRVQDRADELFRDYTELHAVDPTVDVPPRATLEALALADLTHLGRRVDLGSSKAPNVDVSLILRTDDDGVDRVYDRDGLELPPSILPAFLCNASFHAVIVDSLGVPLDLGREERFATRAQRRAVAVRDGGCGFPGCGKPISWLDMHHLVPWDHDGLTDLENLIGLCRLHHGVAHRHRWRVFAEDGHFFFQTGDGRTFWAQRHYRRRPHPPPAPRPVN